MNKLSEQLFNKELSPIVPSGQPKGDTKQPLPQNNIPSQTSAFSQNPSQNGSQESKNEKEISK